MRETILMASRPPLPPLSRAKKSRRGKGGLLLEGEEPGVSTTLTRNALLVRFTVLISICSSILAVQRRSALAHTPLFALTTMLLSMGASMYLSVLSPPCFTL